MLKRTLKLTIYIFVSLLHVPCLLFCFFTIAWVGIMYIVKGVQDEDDFSLASFEWPRILYKKISNQL